MINQIKNYRIKMWMRVLLLFFGLFAAEPSRAIQIDLPPEAQSQLGTTSITFPEVKFPVFNPYLFRLEADPVHLLGQVSTVSAKAQGAQPFNYQTARFTWYFDTVLDQTQSGLGKSSFTFTPKDTNRHTIKVVIEFDSSSDIQQITIRAEDENNFINSRLLEKLQTLQERDADFKKQQAEKGFDALGRASLSASNENPGPGETIDILFRSYSVDLNRSLIQWFVNEKKHDEGVGKTVIYVTMGGIGEKSKIRAVAKTESGETIDATLTITPFALSLYWWTNTSVPYWYKGKALPILNATLYVSAFPRVVSLNAQKKYIYNWSVNNENKILFSGYGKQTISFNASLPQLADRITVSIENFEKTLAFKKEIDVPNVPPEVRFCVVDLVRGCVRTTTALITAGDTVDLKAQPFFFTSPASVLYDWDIDGTKPTTPATTKPWLLTIKTPDVLQGLLNVQISASDKKYKNVTADNSFSIEVKR